MTSIGFLGAGSMATAMAGGLAKTDLFAKYVFYDTSRNKLKKLCLTCPKYEAAHRVEDLLRCDVAVIAVKPQVAQVATKPLLGRFTANQIIISIMAGVTLNTLRDYVGPGPKLVRTMPNAPLLVSQGATGIAAEPAVGPEDRALMVKMFSSIGVAVEVPEYLLDAVTAVSGSGPAYVAVFMEALADAGVREGLPRDVAVKLAAGTLMGAGAMVASGAVAQPAQLKDMVCSPGGTSIAGVGALEAEGLRRAVYAGVAATRKRSQELSKL